MQQKLLKVRLYAKKRPTKNGKGTWIEYSTKMNILVSGEEEKGPQTKWIRVKFVSAIDTKDIRSGVIELTQKQLSAPTKYKTTIDEKGVEQKPCVWIRGFEKYTPTTFTYNQNMFDLGNYNESEETEETDDSYELPF